MLIIRFQRQGKKKDFVFRVIAVDSKIAVNSGKAKEILGWWNPRSDKFELKKERILYWIGQGAQTSDSCHNLLVRAQVIEGKKRPITIHKKKEKKGAAAAGAEASGAPAENGAEAKPETVASAEPAAEEKTEEVPSEPQQEEKPAAAEEKSQEEPKEEKKEDQPVEDKPEETSKDESAEKNEEKEAIAEENNKEEPEKAEEEK